MDHISDYTWLMSGDSEDINFPCFSCHARFFADPHTVSSIRILPETGLPLGVMPNGELYEASAEETNRSVREPICSNCASILSSGKPLQFKPRISQAEFETLK